MTDRDIVRTGVAARKLGVTRGTLLIWMHEGKITPEFKTPGPRGQFRWSISKLEAQLAPPKELPDADEGRPE